MPTNKRSTASDGAFILTRVFDAPLRRVWQAWSEASELQSWWGPKGCSVKVATLEFRPGGFFHYAMRFSNGPETWGRFIYRDIEKQKRIIWLNSFSNEECGITRAPFDALIPLEILNDVTFSESNGRTTVTLRATPHGAAANEVAMFEGMFASLNEGYGGSFEQLADTLAKDA